MPILSPYLQAKKSLQQIADSPYPEFRRIKRNVDKQIVIDEDIDLIEFLAQTALDLRQARNKVPPKPKSNRNDSLLSHMRSRLAELKRTSQSDNDVALLTDIEKMIGQLTL
jgi:hypothetical protein